MRPILCCLCFGLLMACNTSKSTQGAVIGGSAGGVIGGIIGKKSGNTAVGILIGSAVGGTAGALIGKYMDKQAKAIEEEIPEAEVERVGEGILVTFDSGMMFGFDSYALSAETRQNLIEMANIMQEYEQTDIVIEGHTDNVGSENYNLRLSQKRAEAVANYLNQKGVNSFRVKTEGYGENQPINSNETDAQRQKNRRVEVVIVANEELKKDAKSNNID